MESANGESTAQARCRRVPFPPDGSPPPPPPKAAKGGGVAFATLPSKIGGVSLLLLLLDISTSPPCLL
jgi:hypothetical protein